MKTLLLGMLLIIIIGFGGILYRNAIEHPAQPIACPMDALVCPDGTAVGRTGSTCTFPACPPPNVSLSNTSISFAIPAGFTTMALPDATSVAAYGMVSASATATIVVHSYPINASSTALATIQQTAIGGASGAPVGATAYSSISLGTHRFTVVTIQRFEGVVDTAYYLARTSDVLRFDAIDTGVANWTDTNLGVSTLPAHAALEKLLTTLQGKI